MYISMNTGSLPSEIGLLSQLTLLNISYNYFTGSIPMEITDLMATSVEIYGQNRSRVFSYDQYNMTNSSSAQPGYMVNLIYPNSYCTGVVSQMYVLKVNECV